VAKVCPVNTVGITRSAFQQVGQVILLSRQVWERKGTPEVDTRDH